ncbi:MAG: hypothetical protein HY975_01810, partial [Candidatus Kerfeldbacteria bacterium]|nr:hypothetical protein [Candidatus Kerfeldbacteria bacterium]
MKHSMTPLNPTSINRWRSRVVTIVTLLAVIGIGLVVRLAQPLRDSSIGEIDVFFWGLRTQEFLLHGWSGIGTPLWVTPVIMGVLHRLVGGNLYDLFLWAGPFISGIIPVVGIYFLTYELSRSKIAGVVAAFA